jgi:hypothetical protein
MSDSLKATVIVIEPALTISTRPELVDDEDELPVEPPRLPAVALVAALESVPELALDPELALEAEPEPLEETVSPGETAATLTTVPPAGANRRVSFRAFSALRTVASAPSTAACAEAMLAAMISALVVFVCADPEPPLPDCDPPLEPPPPEPPEPPEPLEPLEPLDALERLEPLLDDPEDLLPVPVRVGVVRVGAEVVVCVVVVVGVVWVVVVCVVVDVAGWKTTNSVDSSVGSRLVLVDDPDAPDVAVWSSALVRLSSAEVRLDSACCTVSWAAVGSRVASSCPLATWSPSLT